MKPDERVALLEEISTNVETQMKEAFTEFHADLANTLKKQNEEIAEVKETKSGTSKELSEKLDGRFTQLMADFKGEVNEMAERMNALERERERKSVLSDKGQMPWTHGGTPMGHALTDNDQFGHFVKKMRCSGRSYPIPVPAVSACRPGPLNRAFWEQEEVKSLMANLEDPGARAEIKSISGVAALQEWGAWLRLPDIVDQPAKLERVRDFIPIVPTVKESIQYLEETVLDNQTATVAMEGTKPESGITFVLRRVPVETIATWIPVANQLLDDVPSLRSYLEQRLGDGIMDEEDSQLLYGSGESPDLQGFFTHDNIPTYDPATHDSADADDNYMDMIRRAMTVVRLARYPSDGVVVHPTDFERMELSKGDDLHYLWTLPSSPRPTTAWRLPIIENTSLTEGDFLVGSFRRGAVLYDRMETIVKMSDSHGTFFIENVTVILLESREALVILRPGSFVAGSFLAGS